MSFRPALVLVLIFAALLGGCASFERGDIAAKAKVRMVGMTQAAVQSCMGEPKGKARTEEKGTEIWMYYSSSGHAPRAQNFFKPTGFSLPSNTYEKNYCLVNLTMKKGAVQAVEYLGPTSSDFYNKDDQCGYAVAACLKN